MGRLVVRGKYLYEGREKFFARGVSYGPFPPNSRGERYPEPACADADFALINDLGANLVRVYVPPPPWMFELAAKHQLRMMVGMPWPFHMAFLDSREMMRDIRATIGDGVTAMRQFSDVLLAYSLGNEVRSDIVRWHGPRAVSRFLAELYDLGKQIDPEGLFTYSNYPSAEYLDLSFLDFVCFNIYLHREPDFRRYMTHLLAATRDRPLMLSETGMDTIREGETHQAELLAWQSRAAFEIGLSGFMVFAFTDEWHTGGAEITDWAFGLTTRERARKPAFEAVAETFRATIPPPLVNPPKASVVVAAWNAATTLGACLASIRCLDYPDYEIIVADDGSTDDTSKIAAAADVRVLALPHHGLSAARNAGIAAANGSIVAFIDADAVADRDWLYHLVETLTRTDAAAVGGTNFPPPPDGPLAAAIAAAPGEPREVRLNADELAQACGCSMALDKTRFAEADVFDPAFTTAGDDVDFSWRIREQGEKIGYAPAAVVIHERRATIADYLRQQRGYGRAEGLLYRKYPRRVGGVADAGLYGRTGLAKWFAAGPRVYYGAFGRGLFQTVYPGSTIPALAQIPLTFPWLLAALVLIAFGLTNRLLGALGFTAIVLTIACAISGAMLAPRDKVRGVSSRLILAILWLLGPILRSWERFRFGLRFAPDASGAPPSIRAGLAGQVLLTPEVGKVEAPLEPELTVRVLRSALVRRGLTVAAGNGYDPFDLEIMSPSITMRILLLEKDWQTRVAWQPRIPRTLALPFLALLLLWIIAGWPLVGLLAGALALAAAIAILTLTRARCIPPVIVAAAGDVAAQFNYRVEAAPGAT
jgi:GT2 family glycosyltransferase